MDRQYDRTIKDRFIDLKELLQSLGFEKAKEIVVAPDGSITAPLCSIALQKGTPKQIKSLEVDACFWHDARDFVHTSQSGTPNQLVESLFAHVPQVPRGHKGLLNHLTSLSFRDINFAQRRDAWFAYPSLENLGHLQLFYCTHPDLFIGQLTSGIAFQMPTLMLFELVHNIREVPDQTLQAVEQLLQDTGSDMESLKLCLQNAPNVISAKAIAKHGGSLRRLMLDFRPNSSLQNQALDPLFFPENTFKDLMNQCTNLEELAVAFPSFSLEYHTQEPYRTDYFVFAKATAQAPFASKLRILNIKNLLSEYLASGGRGYLELAGYEQPKSRIPLSAL